jgi:indole-3-acetate monooxygenase
MTASTIVAAARDLAVLARELAPSTEAGRALAPELLTALRASGLFQLGVPRELGGLEAAPQEALAAVEILARGDASAGWCVGIAATSGLNAAYLPPRGAEEVFGSAAVVPAGVWAPKGIGRPVEGGVELSGQWSFCSGINHADWLFAGFKQEVGDRRELRVAALPTSELKLLDTWHTTGLRGTGSHDVVADALFVPEHRTLSLLAGRPTRDTALYRFPAFGYFALSVAAAALGNAQGAIDDAIGIAAGRRSSGSADARRVMAERATTQRTIAEAEASARAARAFLFEAVREAWDDAVDGKPASVQSRASLRLAATNAGQTARRIVTALYDLTGSAAIYDTAAMQRRFRDAHTASAHIQLNADSWELPGSVLLGVETPIGQL